MNPPTLWITSEAWEGFVAMRKAIKKPLTPRAVTLLVHRLEELKKEGQDPNACLDQSTLHCWQSVYPVKTEAKAPTLELWKAEEREWTPAPAAVMEKLKAIRRVA